MLEKEYSRAKAIQNKEFEMFRVKEYVKKIGGYSMGALGVSSGGVIYALENPRNSSDKTNKNEEES